LDGLIRTGFEIEKNHRTQGTEGLQLFGPHRSPFATEQGIGVRAVNGAAVFHGNRRKFASVTKLPVSPVRLSNSLLVLISTIQE
jgi:hypothetical protein